MKCNVTLMKSRRNFQMFYYMILMISLCDLYLQFLFEFHFRFVIFVLSLIEVSNAIALFLVFWKGMFLLYNENQRNV